jgi:hypothetical protein
VLPLSHPASSWLCYSERICEWDLCGLVIRFPGYRTEMYCVSCEVRTECMYVMQNKVDRLCGLVVTVPGYRSGGPGVDCRHDQICWEVVDLKRGPLSLVSITEELLRRKSSGSGLESREYGRRNPLCWPRNIFYPKKLTLTSHICGGHSVGMVGSRTKAMEFVICEWSYWHRV